VPDRIVDAGGLAFDHGDVARFGMECLACHTPPSPDAGGVPRERCLTCHNEPDRLVEYENGDLLHQFHVTDHKIECTNCHLEIDHAASGHMETTRTECSTCHGGRHSPQRDLYAGLGGKGVPPRPDVMYLAKVRCEGCHLEPSAGDTRSAGEISCMSCHGPKYRALYQGWMETLRQRRLGVRRQLDATARLLGSATPAVFADARANLDLVERGRGIHNVPYSLALLQAAHHQINEARQQQGLAALPAPWPTAPYSSDCLDCHTGVESSRVQVFGRAFAHEPHVVGQGMDCQDCHTSHEERESSGAGSMKLKKSSCTACHHSAASGPCVDCHGSIMERAFAVELGSFEHVSHVGDMEIECAECHGDAANLQASPDLEVCSACH
jgi:hypothetical protein